MIETKTMRFRGSPTKHIRACWEVFLRNLALVTMSTQGGKLNIFQRSKTKLPKGEERPSRLDNIEIDKTVKSLTETTAETSSKTSTETNPPSQVPPGSTAGEEEEDLNASLVGKDEVQEAEAARVDAMIEQIAKVTGTHIEITELRPLALECVQREHKDAWMHTLAVLKAKMAGDIKPTILNRYAATVLQKALNSPEPMNARRQAGFRWNRISASWKRPWKLVVVTGPMQSASAGNGRA